MSAARRKVDGVILKRRHGAQRRAFIDGAAMTLALAEQEGLLGRPVRPLLRAADREAFGGERCLVTGAAGSIGGASATAGVERPGRADAAVDQNEEGLFYIERELTERWPGVTLDPVLADVTRPGTMRLAFRRVRPRGVSRGGDKHVTMAERGGVRGRARQRARGGVGLSAARIVGARFVLVSTDKAASPLTCRGRDQAARRVDHGRGRRPLVSHRRRAVRKRAREQRQLRDDRAGLHPPRDPDPGDRPGRHIVTS